MANEENTEEIEDNNESVSDSVDLSSITDTVAENMPEVQDHVIENHKEKEDRVKLEHSDLKDKDGNGFDPLIHKTNKEGEPTTSPKGLLIKRPKPKEKGQKTQTKSTIGGIVEQAPQMEKGEQMARASGAVTANLIITLGVAIGGTEWNPKTDTELGIDERSMLEQAMGDYFVATGRTDMPPLMALTAAFGFYALPRFTMPKTQSRVSSLYTKVKIWWANRKLAKHGLKTVEKDK